MARPSKKLADTTVRSSRLKPGRYSDGDGLYLIVSPAGSKSWAFMWKRADAVSSSGKPGKRYEMGLGRYPDISLADARDAAQECRTMVAKGINPIEARKAAKEPTFGEAADEFIKTMGTGWRNAKHRAQWEMTLGDTYCRAIRGKKVSAIETEDVLGILKPVWQEKPETASRLRGRIERVFDYCRAKGLRHGENPARWRGHLANVLPAPRKLSRGHHAAMPYKDVPAFVARLRELDALAARALELLILCASRSGEVLNMEWGEVDLDAAVWTVPAERMKGGRVHRVPLSARAVTILQDMRALELPGDFVFPGSKPRRPLSNMALAMLLRRMKVDCTVHGFRSSFRDWCGDETAFPREVAEAALAHKVGDDTENAYRRSDALAKRRRLMDAWAAYCEGSAGGNVVALRG